MESKESQEKSDSSILGELLDQLTVDQIRFVVARQEFHTDKEAAEEIGLKPDRVYQWRHTGVPIDDAIRLMAMDGLTVALHVRRKSLAKAMLVKAAGLDEEDKRLRQSVATEIIEWEMGKAKQGLEHSGEGDSGEIVVRFLGNIDPEKL